MRKGVRGGLRGRGRREREGEEEETSRYRCGSIHT